MKFLLHSADVRGLHSSGILRAAMVFMGGNLVATVLMGVGAIVQARFVGPDAMGLFQAFITITGYLTFLHLGVFDGLQRELPLRLGRGDHAAAEDAAAASVCWILLACMLCSLAFVGLALWSAIDLNWWQCAGWISVACIVSSALYGGYLMTTYRTSAHFTRLSLINMSKGGVSALTLFALPWLGYYGLCLRAAITPVIHTLLLHWGRPLPVRPRFKLSEYWSVIRLGLPFGLIGYAGTRFWSSLESTFVLSALGMSSLGLFSIVFLAHQAMFNLVNHFMQVYLPRVTEEWGRTRNIACCVRMCIAPTFLAVTSTLLLVAFCWVTIGPFVKWVIPDYVDALPALEWACLIMPITALRLPRIVFLATGDIRGHGLSIGTGLAVFVIAALAVSTQGGGLVDIVFASLLGQLVQSLMYYVLLYIRLKDSAPSVAAVSICSSAEVWDSKKAAPQTASPD